MTPADQKQVVRRQAEANRRALFDKDERSLRIMGRCRQLPEFDQARSVLIYVDARHEVRTRPSMPDLLASGKEIVVPYCVGDELELFRLRDVGELAPGAFGIWEPKSDLRGLAERRVALDRIDVILVPGVAFDRGGARAGHGFGYYDRLLRGAAPSTALIGLAFDCQVFDDIPLEPHDVRLNKIVTETTIFETPPTAPSPITPSAGIR